MKTGNSESRGFAAVLLRNSRLEPPHPARYARQPLPQGARAVFWLFCAGQQTLVNTYDCAKRLKPFRTALRHGR